MTGSAKQSIVDKKCGLLRRFAPVRKRIAFVAGNNDKIPLTHTPAIPRREPELCMILSAWRAWGMPGA